MNLSAALSDQASLRLLKSMNLPTGLLHSLKRPLLSSATVVKIQVAELRFYYPKEPIDKSEWPEQRKLRMMDKQPNYGSKRAPRMPKALRLMRGPESVHTDLIYKGFGVKALLGGRMKWEHFEAVRYIVNKKIVQNRMFALWRVDAPWQPLSKRGAGKRMGGGKGGIHHYATPVKADRIIVELGGDVTEIEAKKILAPVCEVLPFPTRLLSQKDIDQERENEKWVEENNLNPFTMEYMIKNNLGGCRNWLSKYDYAWFGKYK